MTEVKSGIKAFDSLLNGLKIGDNVIWYDSVSSLSDIFFFNFINESIRQIKPIIYISFDRSPKNLIDHLGYLANSSHLTILDCFTNGKGGGSEIFLKFYEEHIQSLACQIIRVEKPQDGAQVFDALYRIHKTLTGDVRFVFESLTGMQTLWGDEENLLKFYSQTCPRLYELNTIAYWVIEKDAHSRRLKAHLNKIAQVVIDLALTRGRRTLTILKADKRNLPYLNKPYYYWCAETEVTIDTEQRSQTGSHLGRQLKIFRTERNITQTDFAKMVGVTPSNISQIESNSIYPSIPTLLRMAEILDVDVSSFFIAQENEKRRVIFPESKAIEVPSSEFPKGSLRIRRLTSLDLDRRIQSFLLEIAPQKKLPSHFFLHRGDEVGYLLSGAIKMRINKTTYHVHLGDLIYLSADTPSQWVNDTDQPACLLWLKIYTD